MNNWRNYFINAGGISLIKQYFKNHTLFIACNQFLALGKSKKALEILRLSVELKYLNRIKRKEKNLTDEIYKNIKNSHEPNKCNQSKIIWICWWQGIENAPELVKKCYKSVISNFKEWDIRVITFENYTNFIDFPDYIIDKWKKGVISMTHMSDLLRLELLIKYGGLWLDATILSTSGSIPKSILNSDLFLYQTLKPGADGHVIVLSNWLIYAKSNNLILKFTRELLYKYWKCHNYITDYFIFHYYLTIACEFFHEEYSKIPQFSNEIPHILLLNFFNKYDDDYWQDLKRMTCFHKLSYKFDSNCKINDKGTYYDWFINSYEIS